jgi:tetratricopeptide (TPR) repeat protein
LISGEAGIGKSRISTWLAEQVADAPHTRLRYRCSPYHRDSALYPFAQQFERATGIAAQEGPDAKLEKLEKLLALATDRLGEVAPLIAAMLSIPTGTRYPPLNLSPAQLRRQTLFALLDQMEGLARKQPVLMLFEDAHWADATSLEVLDLAIERIRKLPVLLLITFRPEFEAPWRGLPDVTDIALGRLEPTQAEALVSQVTGGRKLPPEVLAQIVAKTDGVPLFVEELTKNVLESGLLVEESERYRLDGPLPPLAIPSTLQDSLMARLDRLAGVKEIAQIGAAIGREFSYSLLQAVVGRDEATLRTALAQLERSELVFRSGVPPAARYTFKHALVQDTAYESLLKSRRRILHQRIAEALRDKFPDVVEAEPELIAEHYTRTGLTEPAIVHWGKAGDLALRRSAFKEAIAHLGKAIEMTEAGGAKPLSDPTADRSEISVGDSRARAESLAAQESASAKLHSGYALATMMTKGFGADETKVALARASSASQVEKTPEYWTLLYGRINADLMSGEHVSARALADTFLTEAEAEGLPGHVAFARRIRGFLKFMRGDLAGARIDIERALANYDERRDEGLRTLFGLDFRSTALAYLGHVIWYLGEIEESERLTNEALHRAKALGQPVAYANARYNRLAICAACGHADSALAAAEEMRALGDEHDLKFWRAIGSSWAGWARVKLGEPRTDAFRAGIAALAEVGARLQQPTIHALVADVEICLGQWREALEAVNLGLALAVETGLDMVLPWLLTLRGHALAGPDPAGAASAYGEAISVGTTQGARTLVLLAALALAKLYQSTGRPVEAHDVLRPALEGFSPTPEFAEIAEAFEFMAAIEAAHAQS